MPTNPHAHKKAWDRGCDRSCAVLTKWAHLYSLCHQFLQLSIGDLHLHVFTHSTHIVCTDATTTACVHARSHATLILSTPCIYFYAATLCVHIHTCTHRFLSYSRNAFLKLIFSGSLGFKFLHTHTQISRHVFIIHVHIYSRVLLEKVSLLQNSL